jgi:hypothetical protein
MAADMTQRIANCFRKLGWLGVWVQALLAIIPLGMFAYVLFGKATGARPTLGFADYLALGGLIILAFTTFWSYRYTRLAARMTDPDRAPRLAAINRTLWVGLWAGCLGIFVSMVLLFFEVVRLLVLFLKAPQAGVPVMRTEIDTRTAWVSAIDVVSLLAELCTVMGELAVLSLTLYLLFAVTRNSSLFDQTSDLAEVSATTS